MTTDNITSIQGQGEATVVAPSAPIHQVHLVHDEHCIAKQANLSCAEPTGADLLRAAGRPLTPDQLVLQVLRAGGIESIRLDERIDLALGAKFILANGDRTYRFTINGKAYEWPHHLISGAMVLELAGIGQDVTIELARHGAHSTVTLDELVDLSEPGIEQFTTKEQTWDLLVGGVLLKYHQPLVVVSDAMVRAGFDTAKKWQIFLIVRGQPKKQVSLDYVVDLRTPGIEKIRLTPADVGNGDGVPPALRRQFKLLAKDSTFLDNLRLRWETISEKEGRWLLIHDYVMPQRYAPNVVQLALNIPVDYPASQIDMFFLSPSVGLSGVSDIPNTQVTVMIDGKAFQRWSRHRSDSHKWDPSTDNVGTHMALVESCLFKEIGE